MSLSGINFSGLGSGIDTESIIQQLLKVDQRPIDLLANRQKQIQQKQTAINQLAAVVTGLQAAASALDNLTSFSTVQASSSDTDVASVTAQAGALPGDHT